MDEARRNIEDAGSTVREGVQDWAESAQDAAKRGTRYVRDQLEQADDKVTEMTGKPLASWSADLEQYVRQHPWQSVAIAVGLGYIVKKIFSRD